MLINIVGINPPTRGDTTFCVRLVLGLGLCPKSGKSGASKALTGNWLLLPTAFDLSTDSRLEPKWA